MSFIPSTWQQAIGEWFRNCMKRGHLIVRARAGTGKTTTILWAISLVPPSLKVIVCAFNKIIADELESRLKKDPNSHPNATAATFHRIGVRAIMRYWDGVRVESDDNRGERALKLAEIGAGEQAPDPIIRLVVKLHTLGRECMPLATCAGDLVELAWDNDLVPDKEWEEDGWGVDEVCAAAYRAMEAAAKKTRTIDFADMIYLPLRLKMLRPIYDVVVADEAQDLSAAQLLMAQAICKGRICVVGDDRQGIYKFRGADSAALDRLKNELNAEELGLKTTYRCGRAIVDLAATLVPDFRAGEKNGAGLVASVDEETMLDRVRPGDFVLSRVNAPLATHCLALLKKGIPAIVRGKDIAKSLIALVKNLNRGAASRSIPAFLQRLANDCEKQVARLEKSGVKNLETRVEQLKDRYATLAEIAQACVSVDTLCAQIQALFEEAKGGRVVVFSSIHKAKGLEADRVWVLADTLRHNWTPKPQAKGGPAIDRLEEENLAYVAYTRAKRELYLVSAKEENGEEKAAG
jgi:DNA helicase-2/ATP-dependent DNA helicase PcrA